MPAIKPENVGVRVVLSVIVGTEGPLVRVHNLALIVPSESLALAPETMTEFVGRVIARSAPALAIGAELAETQLLPSHELPAAQVAVAVFVSNMVSPLLR